MIRYEGGGPGILFTHWRAVLKQTSFQTGIKMGLIGAAFGFFVKFTDKIMGYEYVESFAPDGKLFSNLTFLLGFVIVFHTSQAYGRYMGGVTLIYQMMGDYFDAASLLMSFSRHSKSATGAIEDFQSTTVRLFSMLLMCSLSCLEDDHSGMIKKNKVNEPRAFGYKLMDPKGLDYDTIRTIADAKDCMPEAVYQHIQSLMSEGVENGILKCPPPLLTRVYQELGGGMIKYHEAMKYKDTPFPFPYVAVTEMLLMSHLVITPFMTSYWSQGLTGASCWSFVQVFIMWSLSGIASELDNPYNGDFNDPDLDQVQQDLNKRLISLMRLEHGHSPGVSDTAHPNRVLAELPTAPEVLMTFSQMNDMRPELARAASSVLGSGSKAARAVSAAIGGGEQKKAIDQPPKAIKDSADPVPAPTQAPTPPPFSKPVAARPVDPPSIGILSAGNGNALSPRSALKLVPEVVPVQRSRSRASNYSSATPRDGRPTAGDLAQLTADGAGASVARGDLPGSGNLMPTRAIANC